MVLPLGRVKFVCEKCGWSKVMYMDDQIFGHPTKCPKCSGVDIEMKIEKSIGSYIFDLFKMK